MIEPWKRVVEEAQRQKGKTLFLGGIFLVALVMWVPIVAEWLGGSEEDSFSPPVTSTSPARISRHADKTDWKLQLERRQLAFHTPYPTGEQILRDPFVATKAPEENERAEEPEPEPPPIVTPQQAGLRLNSTLKVGRMQAARINDQLQLHGEEIVIDEKPTGFWLVDVARGHVVLVRDGHYHRMEVPKKEKKNLVIQKVTATR